MKVVCKVCIWRAERRALGREPPPAGTPLYRVTRLYTKVVLYSCMQIESYFWAFAHVSCMTEMWGTGPPGFQLSSLHTRLRWATRSAGNEERKAMHESCDNSHLRRPEGAEQRDNPRAAACSQHLRRLSSRCCQSGPQITSRRPRRFRPLLAASAARALVARRRSRLPASH